MKIKSVFFFPNGCCVCFDEKGEQVGELQKPWFRMWVERAKELGYDLSELNEIKLPDTSRAKIYWSDDGDFNWGTA